MSQKTASRTALATAYMRAAHQLLNAPPPILEDPTALALLGPDAGQRIREFADRWQSAEGRALRAHMVLRSRFAEDRLAAAVGRAVTHDVILGAGGRALADFLRAGTDVRRVALSGSFGC